MELIKIFETYRNGKNDVYDFIVKIEGKKYKVRYVDNWVNGKSKGCFIENVYDENLEKVKYYEKWVDELDEIFFNEVMI